MAKKENEYMCYLFGNDDGGYHRSRGYVATAEELPSTPVRYKFNYVHLQEFSNYDEFVSEIKKAFEHSTSKITLSEEPTESHREKVLCDSCASKAHCDYQKEFPLTWDVNLNLDNISICPHCGSSTKQKRKTDPICTKIHDVRLNGRPTQLAITKNKQWFCTECSRTISTVRIPGIQHTKTGQLTMRLLLSIFNLRMSDVPNGFIAEGYDLDSKYVGDLCRTYRTNAKSEYTEQVNALLASMPADYFYDELVFLGKKRYRAIFDHTKTKFYTFVLEEDLLAALESATEEKPGKIVKRSERSSTALIAFSTLEPARRNVAAGLFEVIQAVQVETKNNSPKIDLVAELHHRLKTVTEEDTIDLNELLSFLCNKDNFRATDYMNHARYLYRSWDKATEVAYRFLLLPKDWVVESDSDPDNTREIRLRKYKKSIRSTESVSHRLPVLEAIEKASLSSKYTISEQLARLQFFNEPSLYFDIRSTYDIPIEYDDDEMPWIHYTQTGKGIPVTCLEHLISTGLLDKGPKQLKCISHRKTDAADCCTLSCPFLG